MNILGLMFLFFIPGLVMGCMFICAFGASKKHRVPAERPMRTAPAAKQTKLYVWDMERDCRRSMQQRTYSKAA